ncbi:hypothetical protein QAD02_008981 [Eretmocerus hayati]|uniref:Uncharacterized protein n=1 Tax=Eretmocerus hayati TaxID=131215 RepID=A0ACC2N8D8_9HYME|nr:hypothetical protein QAD02_008981 [Eretmocerus hayati]
MHPFPPSSQWLWCPPVPYGSPDAFQGHRPGSVMVCPPMTVLPAGHEVRAPAPIRRQRRNRRRRGCATRSSAAPAPHSRTSAEPPTLERVVPVDRPTDVPVGRPTDVPVGRPTDVPSPGVAPAHDDTEASTSVIQSSVAASARPEPLLSVSTPPVTSSLQQYVQRHFDCPLGCCITPAANLSSSSSATGASDSDDTLLANNAFGLRVSRTTFSRMMNSIDSRTINEASDEPSSLSRRVEQPGPSSTDVAVVLGADSTQDRPVLVERRSAFHRYSRPASRSSASSVEILLGPIHADSSPASPTPVPQIMSQSPNRGSPTQRVPSTRRRSTPDASSFEYRATSHRRPHEMYPGGPRPVRRSFRGVPRSPRAVGRHRVSFAAMDHPRFDRPGAGRAASRSGTNMRGGLVRRVFLPCKNHVQCRCRPYNLGSSLGSRRSPSSSYRSEQRWRHFRDRRALVSHTPDPPIILHNLLASEPDQGSNLSPVSVNLDPVDASLLFPIDFSDPIIDSDVENLLSLFDPLLSTYSNLIGDGSLLTPSEPTFLPLASPSDTLISAADSNSRTDESVIPDLPSSPLLPPSDEFSTELPFDELWWIQRFWTTEPPHAPRLFAIPALVDPSTRSDNDMRLTVYSLSSVHRLRDVIVTIMNLTGVQVAAAFQSNHFLRHSSGPNAGSGSLPLLCPALSGLDVLVSVIDSLLVIENAKIEDVLEWIEGELPDLRERRNLKLGQFYADRKFLQRQARLAEQRAMRARTPRSASPDYHLRELFGEDVEPRSNDVCGIYDTTVPILVNFPVVDADFDS